MQNEDEIIIGGSSPRILLDRFESTSITTSGSKVKVICPGLRVQIYDQPSLQSKVVNYVLDGRDVYIESAAGIFFKLSRNKVFFILLYSKMYHILQ